jgi:hypothetical protein
MSEARIDRISNENNTGGPTLSGITTFSGQNYFVPPKGTTAERPSDCPPGSIRFNTDSAHLEYWDGLQWLEFEASNEELGNQLVTNSAGGTGHRGVFFSGFKPVAPTLTNIINYVSISTLGNAQDFGDMLANRQDSAALASSTRACQASSFTGSRSNVIEFVTISSTGNAQDFGDLVVAFNRRSPLSNSTRGIVAGGNTPSLSSSNSIDYFTIATTGNAADFGGLSVDGFSAASFASPVRGIIAGLGNNPSLSGNAIDYITISTTGNGQDFGDLVNVGTYMSNSCSNSVRGLTVTSSTNLDMLNIASTGNSQDFGDVSLVEASGAACASPTRGLFSGAGGPNDANNVIEFVTISTTGDSLDFGDLTHENTRHSGACSNGHGGL